MAISISTAKLTIHGIVQGVGYRYFVKSAAERLKLKGYVRNKEDGSVEAVVFGDKKDIDLFIKSIDVQKDPGPQVFKIEVESQVSYPEPQGFSIIKT